MFDIGFWEIMLISIVGLVVLGPKRLPIAIRSVLKWVNTAKNMANSVKSEISQELKLHEMNENMINASKQGLDTLDPGLKASIDEMKQSAKDLARPYQNTVDEALSAQPNKVTETLSSSDDKINAIPANTESTSTPLQDK